MVLEVDGRRFGVWRKYIRVEWRASQAQRTQWYGKGEGGQLQFFLDGRPWSGGPPRCGGR